MELEHAFTVEAPVDTVYAALLDPERVAPCMPGATLTGVDGTTFTGRVKVKLGPVSLQYKGSGEYTDTDASARKVVIEASGKDAKGNGTAAATVTVTLTGDGVRTSGTSSTDLTVTGKPAQFGRGMISDVGGKILEQFAANLSAELGGGAGAARQESATGSQPAEGASAATATESSAASAASAASSTPSSTPSSTQSPGGGDARPSPRDGSAGGTEASTQPPPQAAPAEAEPLDLSEYAGGAVAKRALPLAGVGALAAVVVLLLLRRRGRPEPDEADG